MLPSLTAQSILCGLTKQISGWRSKRIGHGKLTDLQACDREILNRDSLQIRFTDRQPADDEAANGQRA